METALGSVPVPRLAGNRATGRYSKGNMAQSQPESCARFTPALRQLLTRLCNRPTMAVGVERSLRLASPLASLQGMTPGSMIFSSALIGMSFTPVLARSYGSGNHHCRQHSAQQRHHDPHVHDTPPSGLIANKLAAAAVWHNCVWCGLDLHDRARTTGGKLDGARSLCKRPGG